MLASGYLATSTANGRHLSKSRMAFSIRCLTGPRTGIRHGTRCCSSLRSAEAASSALDALVDLWDVGSTIALPLFDRTSELLAHRGWAKAAAGWDADRPEGQSAAVRMAFGERSVDDLRALVVAGEGPRESAQRLWGAVSAAAIDREDSLW